MTAIASDRVIIASLPGYGNRRWRVRMPRVFSDQQGRLEFRQGEVRFDSGRACAYPDKRAECLLGMLRKIPGVVEIQISVTKMEVEVSSIHDFVGLQEVIVGMLTPIYRLSDPSCRFEDQSHTGC